MIYTVTLNPALDYVVRISGFQTGKINRNEQEHIYPGGKGINVSSILHELGTASIATGFLAGFTGTALQNLLETNGITADFVTVAEGMTRINVKVKSSDETEINGTGPQITEKDFEALLAKLSRLQAGDILILSGSIPSCMHSDAYEQILAHSADGVRFIVDAEKDLLKKILPYRPFLIKPNHIELGAMFDTMLTGQDDIVKYASKLQELGARNVLVSMAGDGAVLVDETGGVHFRSAAHGTVVNSVGAGDSMVAGFLAGYLNTGSYEEALRLGTACGGATAFHSGLASRAEIEAVLAQLSD